MVKKNNKEREKKIEDLIALMTGELSLHELRAKRSIICIQWDEENPYDPSNIYLVDGKKIDYDGYLKAVL